MIKYFTAVIIVFAASKLQLSAQEPEVIEGGFEITHAYADSDGVNIHCVSAGAHHPGALVIMIHGFPDFWYTWRHQMAAIAKTRHVVALDMRGYNRSDKPKGVDYYKW